jgi:peroxiredoxin
LAKAAINNEKFVLTGNTANMTNAYIIIEGKRGSIPVILENTKYTATIDYSNPMATKVEGGEAQALYNQAIDIARANPDAEAKIYKAYGEARKNNDTAQMRQLREEFDQIAAQKAAREDSLIQANANTYTAAVLIAEKMNRLSLEDMEKRFNLLGETAKATEPGKKVAEKIKALKAVAIGQVAPDFTLNTPDGKPLSMHSIKAKVKIIDFWASWCGPCRHENPNVVKIYKEYHSKGLEILGVSLDQKKEDWLKAIEDDGLTWNHVSDLKGWACAAASLYAVSGIPHMIVLDENNVIVAKDLRGNALKEKVAEMLK